MDGIEKLHVRKALGQRDERAADSFEPIAKVLAAMAGDARIRRRLASSQEKRASISARIPASSPSRFTVIISASITVFPVTNIAVSLTPSASRFCRDRSVGAKCRSASCVVSLRLPSSGKGADMSPVRNPAST